MKVLLLNQYYPPDVAPTGQVLHDLARTLVERGHAVDVVCSSRAYGGGAPFAARARLDGVGIVRLPALGLGRASFFGKALDYASFYALVPLRLLVMPKFDLVVSLTTPPYLGLLAKMVAKLKGAKHVNWLMDLYPDVLHAHGMAGSKNQHSCCYRLLEHLTRVELRGSSLVLTLGPDMQQKAQRYVRCAERVDWVPLWGDASLRQQVQPQRVAHLRQRRGWQSDDCVFMYSGNMGLGHRFAELLLAADAFRQRSDLKFVFAGGGPRRQEVASFADQHPDCQIQLLDYVPQSELNVHLASADVHLISLDTAWQGCMVPSKLPGIFSAGRPAIFVGDRHNSLAAWIEQADAGWVVAPNDHAMLRAAILQALDPAIRRQKSSNALAYAAQKFDLRTNTGIIASLLERAVDETAVELRPSASAGITKTGDN